MCSALVAMKVWIRALWRPWQRLGGARCHPSFARASEQMVESGSCVNDGLYRLEIPVGDLAPAGLDHVHRSALSCRAMRSFRPGHRGPGDCSPSRKVVSK